MNVTQLRENAKVLSGKDLDFDIELTFYYDETNNIKKLHLKKGDFNVDYSANFVLGGFAFTGDKPNLDDIFNGLMLQPNIKDVKLKHITTGDFVECLASKKLTTFLNNLSEKPVYLHLSTLNLLYFSLADIVDSVQFPEHLVLYIRGFKAALYEACKANIETVVPILVKYSYPNVSHEGLSDFVEELMTSIANCKSDEKIGPSLEILHQLLQIGATHDNLPLITNSEDHMLIDGLLELYARPIYMFINSHHIFDNEGEIKDQIRKHPLLNTAVAFSNYEFQDSKDETSIQICDILVGLLGKFFKFLNINSMEIIAEKINAMSQTQIDNLDLILRMFETSFSVNEALIHLVDTFETQEKLAKIGKLRAINLGGH